MGSRSGMRARRLAGVASAATIGALVAGVTAGATVAPQKAHAVKKFKGTLTVGNITSVTGLGNTFTGFQAGVVAFFDYYNAHGGINGYKIRLIKFDDAADPAKNSADSRTLVQQDHVTAIVGEASLGDAASQKYLQSQGVPVVGGWATSSAWERPSTNMFVSLQGPQSPYCPLWSSPLAKANGVTSMAFIAQNFPDAVQDANCRMAAASHVGIKVEKPQIDVSLTAVDYTPEIQQAMATGARAIYFSTGQNGINAGIQAGVRLGYKGYYVVTQPSGVIQGLGPSLAKAVNKRVLTSSFSLLPNDPSSYSKELAKFKVGIKRYEPAFASEITAVSGWAAGKLFADALTAAGPNRAAIMRWISRQTHYTFGGLQGPMNYTRGSQPNPCTTSLMLQNGQFVRPAHGALKGPKFNCGPLINPTTGKVNGPTGGVPKS